MTLSSTPRTDGFYMPPEFAPHAGTWMLFPSRPDNWRENARPAQAAFAAVALAIAGFEQVTVGVPAPLLSLALSLLPPPIRLLEMESNDAWMRDVGATFLLHPGGGRRGVDWVFNAWGGKVNGLYAPWDADDAVAAQMLRHENAARYRAPLVLEGGSIHVDGQGTCLTTAECLLHPGRNPHLSQAQIESLLMDYLNVEKVLWIPRGVFNDETTGHVDNLACYLRPAEIALTWTNDKTDPQYERSAEALDYLQSQTDARGRRLKVHKIPQPGPLYLRPEEAAGVQPAPGTHPRRAGERMAGSYVNFYLCNGAAIIPTFDAPQDAEALQMLQNLLPERRVVPVAGREILLGGGNVHCITQQVPAEG